MRWSGWSVENNEKDQSRGRDTHAEAGFGSREEMGGGGACTAAAVEKLTMHQRYYFMAKMKKQKCGQRLLCCALWWWECAPAQLCRKSIWKCGAKFKRVHSRTQGSHY